MDQAWLDSLSEDWNSEPRSPSDPNPSTRNTNPPPAAKLNSSTRSISSRIPIPKLRISSDLQKQGALPLAERSHSNNNISPPKARTNDPERGRKLSRTLSESTTSSAHCDTIQKKKSSSLSPQKNPRSQEVSEWKRRLLHGDVAYGEKCDLFSPVGLEKLFAQPPPQQAPVPKENMPIHESEITFPSSPPSFLHARLTAQQIRDKVRSGPAWPALEEEEEEEEDSSAAREGLEESLLVEQTKNDRPNSRRGAKSMTYKMVDTLMSQDFSENDLSQGSNFLLDKALLTSAHWRKPSTAREDAHDTSSDRGSQTRERSNSAPDRIVSIRSNHSNQSNTTRDEGLTPIFLSRRDTDDGVEFAALDLDIGPNSDELRNRLRDYDRDPDSEEPSLLLPGEATADLARNGYFADRGQSTEDSFRRRPRSLPPIHEMGSSREASAAAPAIPEIRMVQPFSVASADEESVFDRNPDRDAGVKKGSVVSQSKMFGPQDASTSHKPLKRPNEFKEAFHETGLADDELSMSSPDRRPPLKVAGGARGESEDFENGATSPSKKPRKITNFGAGDLDNFDFSDDITSGSNGVSRGWRRTISGYKWNDRKEVHETVEKAIQQRGAKIWTGEAECSSRPYSSSSADSKFPRPKENLATPRKATNGDVEGKRLRISPTKDPTPKRRRTLTQDSIEVNLAQIHDDQVALSRKRKDARHGDDQQHADASVIAGRQILRPRPASRGYTSADPNSRPNSQSSELNDDQRHALEEQTEQLAQIHSKMGGQMSNGPLKPFGHFPHLQQPRKASINTSDYLADAKKIMAAIREKARPRSAMTSNESESDKGPGTFGYEDSDGESTPEAFDRPPSREGNRPLPPVNYMQEDPEMNKRLEKYQEKSGYDLMISASQKQISLARAAAKTDKDTERSISATLSRVVRHKRSAILPEFIGSDPPNIKIVESTALQRKRKHDTSSTIPADDGDALALSHGSNGSSGSSSYPSGSSRASDCRIIEATKVGHLIPEQIADMVFVRQRNVWVKKKVPDVGIQEPNPVSFDDTDEDPFGDIPDLSVDETQEMMRIKAARRMEELRSDPMPVVEEVSEEDSRANAEDEEFEEISEEGFSRAKSDRFPSTEATQRRRLASEIPQRAPGDEESILTNPFASPEAPMNSVSPDRTNKDTLRKVTAMISELRARAEESVIPESMKRQAFENGQMTSKPARNITIQFSSPVASIIRDEAFQRSFNEDWKEDEDSELFPDSILHNRSRNITPSLGHPNSIRKSSLKVKSAFQAPPHGMSPMLSRFPTRQVTTIDEQDEESAIHKTPAPETAERRVSIVRQRTPSPNPISASTRLQISTQTTPTNQPNVDLRFDASLNLTPLSEFTIHKKDDTLALDVSYVSLRRHHEPSSKSRTLSVSVNHLVEKLTDLEPYEPFWEHMKEIELRNKTLTSLHMLDEFCGALVDLDVANNEIDQIDGVPSTVRHLKISHNSLSDLTSWGHLFNLQYVDISNNDLTSLVGLKNLVHLRSLRADNNNITSLDGVMSLDGLLSLRLRGNQLRSVDFMDTALRRLTDLDIKGNGLTNIYNIHELQSLTALNLEENELEIFPSPPQDMFFSLKYLKLSGNRITRINVSRYPNLRLLYLDRNCLGKVTGLYKTKYLDSLSLREQREGSVLDMTFLEEVYEIRKLFLSGNLLPSFKPRTNFLNLQLLELANCGLQTLPPHLGQMMSNLRVLNLNFNAIRALNPLIGILRLKKLHLAGNRLSKLRVAAGVLCHFTSLSKLDVRNNPVTQGFYPTALGRRIIFQDNDFEEDHAAGVTGDVLDANEPFTLGTADSNLDDRYRGRLDLETRLLRRIYEMWVVDGCARLRVLDGLPVDRGVLSRRDDTWEALVRAGVLRVRKEDQLNHPGTPKIQHQEPEPEQDAEDNKQDDAAPNATSLQNPKSYPSKPNQGNGILLPDCDTPRPSIERDDDTPSSSGGRINGDGDGGANWERFDEQSHTTGSAGTWHSSTATGGGGEIDSSSIWYAEDSFA